MMKLKTILMVLMAVLLCTAAFAETETETESQAKASQQPLPLDDLRVFVQVFDKIKSGYVDQVDDTTLLQNAMRGMLIALDPHSSFLDKEAFREMQISGEGQFNGLGVDITVEDGFIKVIAPIDDTPAQRAGILAGDIIVMIDGVAVRGMDVRTAIEGLRGAPGSEVVLTISRPGISRESEAHGAVFENTFDVTVMRAVIKITAVNGEMLEDGFGYIRITSFQGGAGANLLAILQKLESQNGRALNGLVLDLRNNPGGVLYAAVEISDAFLDGGVIVSTRGRDADANHSFHATADDLINDAPMVVLVNGGSASAAEIVAGALQDHQRAIIMGTRTFGKGSVQSVIPIHNGGALKLTTARHYTPSNRSIQARGIVPDIVVEFSAPAMAALSPRQANERESSEHTLREADLAGHLENDIAAESDDGDPVGGDRAARDSQVGAALNLLKGMSLVKLREQRIQSAESVSGGG